MGKLEFDQAPGKSRGKGFFPQLSGMARALDAIVSSTPKASAPVERSADEVQALRDKQAAKLARRAQRAGVRRG